MKYKVGDRVKIKSLDWYNENKDEYGYIDCGSKAFFTRMSNWCGKIVTIKEIYKTNCYRLEEYDFDWTDEMIEGLAEEETLIERVDDKGLPFNEWLSHKGAFHIPDGYELKDENGNVINATKIVLEKKKKKYPKTYEECYKVLGIDEYDLVQDYRVGKIRNIQSERIKKLNILNKLLICRDAYWKIAGDEMGLGKPWEPDSDTEVYNIYRFRDKIGINCSFCVGNCNILEFPTEEMRDAFKENFDPDIEFCKELL